jgi:fibronectin type 3 domain-containing protein
MEVKDQTLELKSSLSDPVTIDVKDEYAPERPRGLAAVAAISEAAAQEKQTGIDLSWQPNIDAGLVSPVAGYVVYRRTGNAEWQRISGPKLIIGPAFHDADVQSGATYTYSITAVGANTLESPRSEVATETVQ